MAIPFRIVLYARDGQQATNAAQAAFARIHALNGSLSDYDPESELSRLSQTAGTGRIVPLSPDLAHVLDAAERVSRATDGAFDVTVGPLSQLWRRARRQRALPDPARLDEARRAVGWRHLELTTVRGPGSAHRSARLIQPGMRLDLGGIAKGYALDEATRILQGHGLRQTLVTGAGDMVAGDPPPGQAGWRIELPPIDLPGAPPPQTLWLRHGALCTSGDLFQHVEIDGVRYSHIVDPRVGLGLTDHSLVTVLGPNGMIADAFSTAISIMPAERSLRIAPQFGIRFRSLRAQEGQVIRLQSRDFPR